MIYRSLIKKRILKIFFLNILFNILITFSINPAAFYEIYRSNYNGLKLVKISPAEAKKFKFVLYSYVADKIEQRRILYENDQEVKKWIYTYMGEKLSQEKYYKDNQLQTEYRYDNAGHKIKQEEYKNNSKIKITTFAYNSDGLVDLENVYNIISKQNIAVKYRYDKSYQIKQIEKKYSDGSFIYWESFFSDKGIIQKEFYTLKNEVYTFWYNDSGQELKGEVRVWDENNQEQVKKEWVNQYSDKGKKTRKEENDYFIDKKIITLYNNSMLETRVEEYSKDKLDSIQLFEYNDNNKVLSFEKIEDLTSNKTFYTYDNDKKLTKTTHYTNGVLKKVVVYNNEDNTRIETIFVKDKQVEVKYDKDGNIIQ